MKDILRLSLPITAWLVGFSAVYALQGFSCSRHWPDHLDAASYLLAAWGVAILIQLVSLCAILSFPATSRFVQNTAAVIAVGAFVAALWTSLPILTGAVCS